MWVKICGITNFEDAECAVNAGADALGFVFYDKSPRYIIPHHAQLIIKKLPSSVKTIGLFVGATPKEINHVCKEANIDLVQIHFDVDKAFLMALEVPYIRVVRAQEPKDVQTYEGTLRLVDAYVEGFGGAGQRIDLSWFEKSDNANIIIAGGLTPENLDEIKPLGFYGVDVSSGVEKAKGIKDHEKMKAFIKRAKA